MTSGTNHKPRDASLRVRVTQDELERLQKLAAQERRTVSQLVWIAVQDYLRSNEREPA